MLSLEFREKIMALKIHKFKIHTLCKVVETSELWSMVFVSFVLLFFFLVIFLVNIFFSCLDKNVLLSKTSKLNLLRVRQN